MAVPLVTAIVDTFNHEKFIEQALNSVFDQGFSASELEVLVVDDGSTDRTPDVVKKFPGVQVIRKQNGGQGSAFNAAIPRARGQIVAFLDGDDWWEKTKLMRVIEVFSDNPQVGVVGHGFYEVDELLHRQSAVVPKSNLHVALGGVSDGISFRGTMCFFGTSRVAIRKPVLDLVGAIPDTLVVEADEFMSTMAIAIARGIIIQEPLTFYRLHSGNLYQFRGTDTGKIRRKMDVLVALEESLKRGLPSLRVHPDVVNAIIEPIKIESKSLKLSLVGGMPWETFSVERATMRLAFKGMTWKYHLFKLFVLAAALVLPPKTFYKVRAYYSKMNLRRLRSFTGEPVLAAPIFYNEGGNAKQGKS